MCDVLKAYLVLCTEPQTDSDRLLPKFMGLQAGRGGAAGVADRPPASLHNNLKPVWSVLQDEGQTSRRGTRNSKNLLDEESALDSSWGEIIENLHQVKPD